MAEYNWNWNWTSVNYDVHAQLKSLFNLMRYHFILDRLVDEALG